MKNYICIECRQRECEPSKNGYHLRCPSCEGYNKEVRISVEIFSKEMKLNPKNNYLTHELYNLYEL